jgi:hypothetical protein
MSDISGQRGTRDSGSGYFSAKPFLYKYPNNLIPIILRSYKAYEDGTDRVFRNIGT